ncbi:MAG: hypothetical protein AAGA63_00405, partial [Pseudomonadota bacterium]
REIISKRNPGSHGKAPLQHGIRSRPQRESLKRVTVSYRWYNTVGDLMDVFKPDECANYFIAAGYDPV